MKRDRTSIPRVRRSLLPVAYSLPGSKVVAGLRDGISRQSLQTNAPSHLQNGPDTLSAVALRQVVSELTQGVELSGWLPNLAR